MIGFILQGIGKVMDDRQRWEDHLAKQVCPTCGELSEFIMIKKLEVLPNPDPKGYLLDLRCKNNHNFKEKY